jgi:hypothetical protein
MELFKHIGTYQRDNTSDFPPTIKSDVYFSELLQLYIEVYNDHDYMLYKPIEHLNELDEVTCQKIKEQLYLGFSSGIGWMDLFNANYVNLFLLDGPQPTKEPKEETVFELLSEKFKP